MLHASAIRFYVTENLNFFGTKQDLRLSPTEVAKHNLYPKWGLHSVKTASNKVGKHNTYFESETTRNAKMRVPPLCIVPVARAHHHDWSRQRSECAAPDLRRAATTALNLRLLLLGAREERVCFHRRPGSPSSRPGPP